jgi:hypothetical protein
MIEVLVRIIYQKIQNKMTEITNRNRPYDGQPHTQNGERGKTMLGCLTIRDVADCFAKALINIAGKHSILEIPLDEWSELWIETGEKDEQGEVIFKPIPEMEERIKNDEFVGDKVSIGTWTYEDLYKIEDNFDPIAVIQNACCNIEKMLGIFPNIKKHEND